ncbi:hypothetical protein GOP47_0000820 [Adiantum capillus-veneris]|uniref:BHLH domain-containing protein n=1 Tax=Adiantum capillus-veneris TaxID=13818 RepID=A0A9D4VFG3_ADICA|nr:hypothetical protein GOP47_0000820 [Adiantum capillus-veneris]
MIMADGLRQQSNITSKVLLAKRPACSAFDDAAAQLQPDSKKTKSVDQVDDPLALRWSILKQLLPLGSQVQAEKDELLQLVFEYVQDLETQIKSFKHEGGINTSATPSDQEMGALQKKGLCIVPLSKLTRAF